MSWRDDIQKNLNTRGNFQILNSGGAIVLTPENDEEKKLMDDIEKTVIQKVNRLSKTNENVVSHSEVKRDTHRLKKLTDDFLEFKEKTQTQKVLIKYKQAVEYLLIFFGEKQLVKQITRKEVNDFRLFLMEVPKMWKNKKDLKDKNLKKLVQTKSKLLLQYEKQAPRTVDEVIKKCRTVFEYFVENLYITVNPFTGLKPISNGKQNKISWRAFSESELKTLFYKVKEDNLTEEYNYLKFLLLTGLRRGESLKLSVKDIDFEKCYLNISSNSGTKTENAVRIVPIHKDLKPLLEEQMSNKTDECFLFFNDKNITPKYREERVGTSINNVIGNYVDEKIKNELNIHSFRKNFSQELFLSDLFKELDLKTIIGHSTNNDITDKHYLMGRRNYKEYKEKIDKVNFSKFYASPKLNDSFDNKALDDVFY